MTILVDNPADVEVRLNQEPKDEPAVEPQEPRVPDKFKGKSAEEIASAYVNLESEVGRLRNELGDYRSMTDRFLTLEEKRVADLGKADPDNSFEIDPTELLANPQKVLDQYYTRRLGEDPNVRGLQERLDRIEGSLTQGTLKTKHPDLEEVTNDPAFHEWVKEKSYRTRIAQEAVAKRDVEALDDLLTEYKGGRSQTSEAPASARKQNESSAARKASTESSSTGSAVNTAKRFSRRKLVELKVHNPEEYAARSHEILMAYAEGRVDD